MKRVASINKIPKVTDKEYADCNRRLFQTKLEEKSCILRIVPGYSHHFQPLELKHPCPPPLTELYNPKLEGATKEEIFMECENIFASLKITEDDSKNIEIVTRGQSTNESWYEQRAGVITGSHAKQVLRTNLAVPARSLLHSICYPQLTKFKSNEATR